MKPHRIILIVLVSACLLYVTSCKGMWQAFRSTAAPAGGAVGGAALGSLAGPVGTIAGAGVGAALGDAMEENASFRTGETVGEGALKKQLAALAVAYGDEKAARIQAKIGKAWALKWAKRFAWTAGGLLVLFLYVRGKYFGKVVTGKAIESRFWTFIHAFLGRDWTRKRAFGFDPMPRGAVTKTDQDVIVARLEKSA